MKRVSYLGQVDQVAENQNSPRSIMRKVAHVRAWRILAALTNLLMQAAQLAVLLAAQLGLGPTVVGGVDFAAVVLRWSGVWISQPWSYGGRGCHFLFENEPFSTPLSACRKPFPI